MLLVRLKIKEFCTMKSIQKKRKLMIFPVQTLHRNRVEIRIHGYSQILIDFLMSCIILRRLGTSANQTFLLVLVEMAGSKLL